jgi:Delta7-sterol 5-desaturase
MDLHVELTTLLGFTKALLLFFAVVVIRYFLMAGLFHFFFCFLQNKKWQQRKISNKPYSSKQFRNEVKWSIVTSFIFAFVGVVIFLVWQRGYTKIYTDVNAVGGSWYLPLSFFISMLIHETYYYWLHRWMHLPQVFKVVHKVHHQSNITSAWTAFSFHPLESVLQAIILPLILLCLPMHVYVLLTQLTIMTLSSIINHLDVELYPRKFHKHAIGRWLIGASHHALHHKEFKTNYGLYFTFWDKWKKTESAQYEKLFEEKTS